jgi:uracil-DNA glycosylase
MSLNVLFVGEEPSETAKRKGWKWGDLHLCSKTLIEALDAAGFPAQNAVFENLFIEGQIDKQALNRVRSGRYPIVAMGRRVENALNRYGVMHTPMVHPAARGEIRKAENYQSHVREIIETIKQRELNGRNSQVPDFSDLD